MKSFIPQIVGFTLSILLSIQGIAKVNTQKLQNHFNQTKEFRKAKGAIEFLKLTAYTNPTNPSDSLIIKPKNALILIILENKLAELYQSSGEYSSAAHHLLIADSIALIAPLTKTELPFILDSVKTIFGEVGLLDLANTYLRIETNSVNVDKQKKRIDSLNNILACEAKELEKHYNKIVKKEYNSTTNPNELISQGKKILLMVCIAVIMLISAIFMAIRQAKKRGEELKNKEKELEKKIKRAKEILNS